MKMMDHNKTSAAGAFLQDPTVIKAFERMKAKGYTHVAFIQWNEGGNHVAFSSGSYINSTFLFSNPTLPDLKPDFLTRSDLNGKQTEAWRTGEDYQTVPPLSRYRPHVLLNPVSIGKLVVRTPQSSLEGVLDSGQWAENEDSHEKKTQVIEHKRNRFLNLSFKGIQLKVRELWERRREI